MAYSGLSPYYGATRHSSPSAPQTVHKTSEKVLLLSKTARGNANLLHEGLVNAEGPQDLWGGLIQEFRTNCLASLRAIDEQTSWVTEEIYRASVTRSLESPLTLQRTLKGLEGARSEVVTALRLYDGLERVGTDRAAQEQLKNDFTIQLLTARSNTTATGSRSHTPSRSPSPSNHERYKQVSGLSQTANGHADLLRDTLVLSSMDDLSGSLIQEFHKNCLESQKEIFKHMQWADEEAARSRRRARSSSTTQEEALFNGLIASDQRLTEALRMHDDMRRESASVGMRLQETSDPGADLQGLAVARAGKGNAELLQDALQHAKREDLTSELIQEFRNNCCTSQKDIIARIPPASAAAEESRNVASGSALTREEQLLEELLVANEPLIKALEMYEDIEHGRVLSHPDGLKAPVTDVLSKQLPTTPSALASALEQHSLAQLPPLTMQDKAKFTKIFYAWKPKNGVLPGSRIRDLMLKSNLPQDTLSRIWDLADVSLRGALDVAEFTIAMYLVQTCMSGQLKSVPPSLPPALYEQAGSKPLPGLPPGGPTPGPSCLNTPGPSTSTPAPSVTGYFDVGQVGATHADKVFSTLDLERTGRAQGYVITSFMLRLGLSMEAVSHIIDLIDTGRNGSLTRDEFARAMQLADQIKAGKDLPALPSPSANTSPGSRSMMTTLAPSTPDRETTLIDLHATLDPASVPLPRTPTTSLDLLGSFVSSSSPDRSQDDIASVSPLQAQATGLMSPSDPTPMSTPPHGNQQAGIQQWDVDDTAKARYDRFFDTLDKRRRGYIEGDVAVPFFAKSKLPDQVMANIWNLTDINGDGRLTRDEFAVAMYLVHAKLKGKDLPRSLPPTLVPPSLRHPPPLPPRGASLQTSRAPPQPISVQPTGASSVAPPAFSDRVETPPPSYEEVVGSGFR